jgi:hypothetical protein
MSADQYRPGQQEEEPDYLADWSSAYPEAEIQEVQGTIIVRHTTIESFATSLGDERSDRLFYSEDSSPDGSQAMQSYSFVNPEDTVHVFTRGYVDQSDPGLTDQAEIDRQIIHEALNPQYVGEQPIETTGGEIIVDENSGDIQKVYRTNFQEKPPALAAQVTDWRDDVVRANAEKRHTGYALYAVMDEAVVVQYKTKGVDGASPRTICFETAIPHIGSTRDFPSLAEQSMPGVTILNNDPTPDWKLERLRNARLTRTL